MGKRGAWSVGLGLMIVLVLSCGVASATIAVYPGNPVAQITTGPEPDSHVQPGPETFAFVSNQSASTFQCLVDAGSTGDSWHACTSPTTVNYSTSGWHSLGVRAITGNRVGEADLRHFFVEGASPPPPPPANPVVTFTAGPAPDSHVSRNLPILFSFVADQPGSTFQCLDDGGAGGDTWQACTSPALYVAHSPGWHSLGVRAINGGRVGEAELRHFYVDSPHYSLDSKVFFTHVPRTTAKLLSRGVTVKGICDRNCTMTVRLVLSKAAAARANVQSPVAVHSYRLTGGRARFVRVRVDPSPAAILGATKRVRGLRAVVTFKAG